MVVDPADNVVPVRIGPAGLEANLGVPTSPGGLVIFAHGSGSGRLSPRNNQVAAGLRKVGLATLLLDLLTPEEERNRANVFDIALLASRLRLAARSARMTPDLVKLPIGYFGASTGAAAALVAAANDPDIAAVVSRGGRPDLAGEALDAVRAPTLLIVGGADIPVIPLNRSAFERLRCERELVIVPGAGHLFEEPGALEDVVRHAARWFLKFVPSRLLTRAEDELMFRDRHEAGRRLAAALIPLKREHPMVLALPRGGVPVGFEVAQALDAPLDVVLVRKIGAPGHAELGIGAVVDGPEPQLVLNDEIVRLVEPEPGYIDAELARQLTELERRRKLYRDARPPPKIEGQTVIVIDDGIATGGTMKAVLQALSRAKPKRLVLAVPVAPRDSLQELSPLADEVICLSSPEPFLAVGAHYRDFTQTTDEEVIALLRQAAKSAERKSA
jgi:putative phosphoribosyl transferase